MTRNAILSALAAGPRLVEELMKSLGFTYDKTHNSLARLERRDEVVRLADKRYALAEQAAFVGNRWVQKTTASVPAKPGKTFVFGSLDNPTRITPGVPAGPPAPPAASQKTIVTDWVVVYDRSSSMGVHRQKAHASINKTLEDIRQAAALNPTQVNRISLYQFNQSVQREYFRVPAEQARSLSTYYPSGSTALFDATTDAINDQLTPQSPTEDVSVVVLVITDGEENMSFRSNVNSLKELIRKVQATDRWTVTFQVPNGYKSGFVQAFGIPDGNVVEWEQTDRGFDDATAARSLATVNYATQRAAGATKSTSFYVRTDLSGVTSTDLAKLNNIAGQCKVWEVPKEQDIESFIESKLGSGSYVRGTAFYELTKTEKVQPYKKVLVMEKDKKSVFAGAEARRLLGLPDGVEARVHVGNHANFNVFGQSTSNNRILVRGTKVVYWPGALSA